MSLVEDEVHAGVTRHAEKRVRKRIGLPKKSVGRHADKALFEGAGQARYSGRFRRYLDGLLMNGDGINAIRVLSGVLYLFSDHRLVTCWPVPAAFRGAKPSPA